MTDRHRETLRALIANIPGIVCQCRADESRTMLFISDAIEAITGYPASDFVGESPVRTFASVMHPDDVEPSLEDTRAAVDAGRPYVNEFRLIDADGRVHWILAKGQASRDANGQPLYLDGTMFDITDRKEMEDELRRAKQDAEAATRAQTEFLAQMSHELRSPLNAILGFVDLLIRDPEVATSHREKLGIVDRSGKHLLDMIDQILGLSRLEAGTVEVKAEDFDVTEALEDVVTIAKTRAEEKGLGFSLELDPAIAPVARGDPGKIRQVLTNLLGNAVRYTTEGGVWVRARSVPRADDPSKLMLEIDVADTGPGIPADQLGRIFDRFYRGDGTHESDSGAGLGLSIARALVDAMGGEIAAASEPGRGSLFKVRIPVEVSEEDHAPSTEPPRIVGLEPGQTAWRVLVVDDDPVSRLLLTSLLQKADFIVREAENGEIAVKLAEEWRPHLIWMDLRMRVMDGYEATRAIRELQDGASPKIIGVSAGAALESRSAVLDAGFDDLVSKPYGPDEILDAMARHLGARFQRRALERGSTSPSSVALSPAMLAELPPELLTSLRRAALRLDRAATNEVIVAIEVHAPTTARALRVLMQRFRMGRLLELLGEVTGGEGEA